LPNHIYRFTKRRSSDATTKPTRQQTSPPSVTRSQVTSLTKTLSCFLCWQLTPFLDVLDPSSNTSSLTFNQQAHSYSRPPNLKPPQRTPKVCASQGQKDSSTWPITIGKPYNCISSTVTPRILSQPPLSPHSNNSDSLSQKHSHINFMTALYPLHPQAILILPILVNRKDSKTK